VPSLLRLLYRSPLCSAILTALGTLGEHAPLDRMVPFLDSTNFFIRASAVEALRQPGLLERTPVTTFLYATGDTHVEVRDEALKALQEKEPRLAIECCIAALGNRFVYQRSSCLVAFQILQELQPAIVPEIIQEATTSEIWSGSQLDFVHFGEKSLRTCWH
jgi:hypothetical protein